MYISYGKFIKLKEALNEYSKRKLEDNILDNAIFNHFVPKYFRVVFQNKHGVKAVFMDRREKSAYKQERKNFKKFING